MKYEADLSEPCDRSLPSQPISIRKAQSRKKATNVSAMFDTRIIQSCYFDYRMKKNLSLVLAARSAFRALFTWSRHTTCAKDHGLFILITHKSTRSEREIQDVRLHKATYSSDSAAKPLTWFTGKAVSSLLSRFLKRKKKKCVKLQVLLLSSLSVFVSSSCLRKLSGNCSESSVLSLRKFQFETQGLGRMQLLDWAW